MVLKFGRNILVYIIKLLTSRNVKCLQNKPSWLSRQHKTNSLKLKKFFLTSSVLSTEIFFMSQLFNIIRLIRKTTFLRLNLLDNRSDSSLSVGES